MSDFNRGSERVSGFFSKKLKQIMMGGMALVIATSALLGVYKVDTTEVAVIDRFGAIESVKTEPGLNFKIPFVDGATFYKKDIQSFETTPMTIKTEDGQELQDVRLKVQWKIQPGEVEFYRNEVRDPEGRLASLVEAVAKGQIGKVNTTDIALKRSEVESMIKDALTTRADALYKLDVTNIEFSNFEFTDKYAQQIEQNMEAKAKVERAKQEAEEAKFLKEKKITEAQGQKESEILKAQGEAESTRLKADAEAHKIKTEGEAQADAIKAQAEALADNPLLVELEKAKRWGGDVPSTVVGEGATPIINLDGGASKVVPVPGK